MKFKIRYYESNFTFDKYSFKKPDSVLPVPEYDGIGYKNNTYYRRKVLDM